jgi:hypothetical protein
MKNEFTFGDSVIALSSGSVPNQPREKGKEYTVTDIMYCSSNGEQLININNTRSSGSSGYMTCGCGKKHHTQGLAFTYSKCFVLNDPNAIQEKLEHALDEEDYETAIVIRDVIL